MTAEQRALRSLAAVAYFKPKAFEKFLKYARGMDEEKLAAGLTRAFLVARRWEPAQVDEMVEIILALRRHGWPSIH